MLSTKERLVVAGLAVNVLGAAIAPGIVGHSAHPAAPYAASLVSVGETSPGAYEDRVYEAKRASRSAFRKPICDMAHDMDKSLPDCAEKSAGLRKLLEAKDCLVRAKTEAKNFQL